MRALREVRGAASGVDTTHALRFCAALFEDRVNLRVHAIPNEVLHRPEKSSGDISGDGILAA